jgi:small subunit ribosomal protein S20
MPQHKSAIKRVRQNAKRAERNKSNLTRMKTLVKKVRSSTTKDTAADALKTATKYLDRLSAKGLIHKNNAANQKSKLSKFVNNLGA